MKVDRAGRVRLKPGEQRLRSVQREGRRAIRRVTRGEQSREDGDRQGRASVDPPTGPFYTPAAIRPTHSTLRVYWVEQPIRTPAVTRTVATLFLLCSTLAGPLSAQGPDAGDGMRFGVSFGGISTVALSVEFFRDARSIDIGVGTWSFRDISVSTTVRQYFGASNARPVVGAGLWLAAAAPSAESERTGFALVLRAPIGLDWAVADRHATGLVLNVNRGLWVKRSDPEDDLPLNRRLVPLPELYYRFTR